MAKFFYWIIVAPLAVAIVVFSVNNQTEVTLDLWPLDTASAPLPVFLIVLSSMVAGFLAGGLVAWKSAGRTRTRARAEARRADQAERELAAARDRIDRLLTEAAETDRDVKMLPPNAA